MADPDAGARGATTLRAIAEYARSSGADSIARESVALADQLAEERFFVACVGQHKRGKSSLINALVGQPLLPTGVVPVTSVITVLRWGAAPATRVRLRDGTVQVIDQISLPDYVTEAGNPGNVRSVAEVEVYVPSPLLASGLCLVDTPGIGSVFAANTDATRGCVPRIDAVVLVTGADPPISGDELGLVEEIGPRVGGLVVVLNKADKDAVADVHEAAAFARAAITRRLGRDPGFPLLVSAAERLAGSSASDGDELEGRLRRLSDQSSDLMAAAARRGTLRLARALARDIGEQRAALTMPLADAERRLNHRRSTMAGAQVALRELSACLDVEQAQLSTSFAQTRDTFVAHAVPAVARALDDRIDAEPHRRGPALRTRAMDLAMDVVSETVQDWVRRVEPHSEGLYRVTMARFTDLANEFLEHLTSLAGETSSVTDPLVAEEGFRVTRQFHFTGLLRIAGPTPLAWALDWLLPRGLEMRAVKSRAAEYARRLVATNSARVVNDLNERVLESRRGLERDIRSRLTALVESATRALDQARTRRSSGEEAVRERIDFLDRVRRDIEHLLVTETGP